MPPAPASAASPRSPGAPSSARSDNRRTRDRARRADRVPPRQTTAPPIELPIAEPEGLGKTQALCGKGVMQLDRRQRPRIAQAGALQRCARRRLGRQQRGLGRQAK